MYSEYRVIGLVKGLTPFLYFYLRQIIHNLSIDIFLRYPYGSSPLNLFSKIRKELIIYLIKILSWFLVLILHKRLSDFE